MNIRQVSKFNRCVFFVKQASLAIGSLDYICQCPFLTNHGRVYPGIFVRGLTMSKRGHDYVFVSMD
jgi:hypothetical protein